jgi:galactitol-specific phosphotransferase system IIB component
MKLIFLILLCGFSCIAAEDTVNKHLSIYYIPFEIETYIAVTPKSIVLEAHYVMTVTNEPDISQFNALVTSTNAGHFIEKRVRLLAVFDKGRTRLLIDSDGNVLEEGQERALSPIQLKKVETFISILIRKDSINPKPDGQQSGKSVEDEVKQALPLGTSMDKVDVYLTSHKLEHSFSKNEKRIYAIVRNLKTQSNGVSESLSIVFGFDETNSLTNVQSKIGYTGP